MYDVIIIGAGVSGCAIARELSRKKGKILVVERAEDVCCGTSKANSAIVHAGYDAKHGTLMAKLNVQGSRMMPKLAKELDFHYENNGSLVVMMSEEDRPALMALYENGLKNGVEQLQILERDALRAMEPNISDNAVAALYAPTGAIVCPFGLTFALAENAAKNGVQFQFDSEVTDVQKIDGGWKVVTVKGTLETKAVVNAAGVYSDKIHNMVSSETMTITPRRGDYFLLDRATQGFVKNTIFQLPGKYGKGVLVAPTVHGNTIVGPTAIDIEDKDGTATTQAGLDDVRSKSGIAVKNLPLRQTITSFAGLRAHEARHEFFIGEIAPGFVDCAAIESPGLSSAPAIGVMVADIVNGILHLEDNPNFDGTRKGILDPKTLSPEAHAALIRENPAYGNVICRCETITEGEIVDAIHRTPGARSLDGVKRHTRAGMGRCQGGFCSPRVMEILSRELGIPMDQVTKSGGNSKLIVGTNKDSL
ncbi:MAG TPA: NAD(P)/FAD-dependent oxidoreductase [Candidatus Faecousia faecavium]|nr:NAD(P)/FAD-dependent oxidoreductase [Candidatus Faecousia faecavium]